MSELRNKSMTDLRGIAQSFGVADIFKKDQNQLLQAIEIKQKELSPVQPMDIPKPAYDARLMTKPPAKKTDRQLAEEYLAPYVVRGLHIAYDEERWYMRCGKRTDEGTLRMPPAHLLKCAEQVMG